MRPSSLLLAFAALALPAAHAQNTNCDGRLESQAEVDAFDCVDLAGGLYISGSAITNLQGLAELRSAVSLEIRDSDSLPNLGGLDSLFSIANYLYLQGNDALVDLEGLNNLSSIGGGVLVEANDALTSFEGLDALSVIGGDVSIFDNAELRNLGGLNALSSVGGYLTILSNDRLLSFDGLGSLSALGEDLTVKNNAAMESLRGLESLASVGEKVVIEDNDALASLTGLSSLSFVGDDLNVGYNDVLTNIDALAGVQEIGTGPSQGDLLIRENPLLVRCAVGLGPVLAADQSPPTSISGDIEIRDNAPGGDCNSEQDVLDTYLALPTEAAPALTAAPLTVHPNPAAARATFTFALSDAADASLVVYDALGREVARLHDGPAHGSEHITFDAGVLPAGLYVARLVAGERVETARLTVLR